MQIFSLLWSILSFYANIKPLNQQYMIYRLQNGIVTSMFSAAECKM